MAHQPQDTSTSSVGFENSIRQTWSAGSKVKILSSQSNDWVIAHIVTIHKDWLYCLLDDGDTKKIDRWDATVQPVATNDLIGDGEDDEDLFWMKDSFGSTPSGNTNDLSPGQSMSLGFSTLAKNIGNDFSSMQSPRAINAERESKRLKNEQQKMCGYTIWVQWCDSSELHGYYQCVGLRNNRYHFKHRRNSLAELFADDKGYWYLMYDSKCLYKSKKKGHDDPPPRQWKCIEGSLPPPGVSQVALPDDSTPMVIIDEEKKKQSMAAFAFDHDQDGDDESDSMSTISGISRATTVQYHSSMHTGLQTPKTTKTHGKKKSKAKKSKKSKKNKLNLAKLLMDEFDVAIDVLDFNFDGSKQVAFHLNIARHMEVTKCKQGGQAQKLGVLQGDILLKINDEDISKNWEKATNLLRSYVSNKQQFTITFVRRKVENLVITVVRAGNSEFNGKYKFYKRDAEDEQCPVYVKNDHDDDFDFDIKQTDMDPLNSNSEAIHIIQRVYSNPDNFEALWVLKNGRDEHYYMCVTNEYLPPQHGWELVPESEAGYPAPGLQFTSAASSFGHVDRLRGYSNEDGKEESKDGAMSKVIEHHDALNINNRNRTNIHRHEKTLTRMRQTLGNADEFNNAGKNAKRSRTGGASGYMPSRPGMGYAAQKMGKKGGFGSKLFGGIGKKKKPKIGKKAGKVKERDGNESAPETDEDTAKIEAIWKQKLEQTTKNAINQLTTQHKEEINKKSVAVDTLKEAVDKLRYSLSENSEYYYQLYLEKCELSLILQEKQIEIKRSKDKQKEMGKRYFSQQQKSEELEMKLAELSSTFSSRMNAIQQKTGKHRPTPSTVSDLESIEQQFRSLIKNEKKGYNYNNNNNNKNKNKPRSPSKLQQSNSNDATNEYLENEIIKLNEKINDSDEKLLLMGEENKRLKFEKKSLQDQLASKQGGSDQFYAERTNKLTTKISLFQQNIYNLMSLLQNVEQEYMQKCGKLPKVTKAIDWRNEYDPKKYKAKIQQQNGQHPNNQTFVEKILPTPKKKKKKHKNKDKGQGSATQSMTLPHEQRWGGFDLGKSGDHDAEANTNNKSNKSNKSNKNNKSKPRHRGNKHNESRIIDL